MFGSGVSPCLYLASAPSCDVALPSSPRAPRSLRASLVLTTAMASALGGLFAGSAQARTVDACGPVGADGSVVCAPSAGAYQGGIAYDSDVLDLSVALQDGVVVALPARTGAVPGIALNGYGDASVALTRLGTVDLRTSGDNQQGVRVQTEAGSIQIDAPRLHTVGAGSTGLFAHTLAGGSINIVSTNIFTTGTRAAGIDARALAGGDVSVVADGLIRTFGTGSTGIIASAVDGNTQVEAAAVVTHGDYSDAIVARGNNVQVGISGLAETHGYNSYGAYVRAHGGDATVTLNGTVSTEGVRSNGIDVQADGSATLSGTGSITTTGPSSFAVSLFSGTGDAVVDLTKVVSSGDDSTALFADSERGNTFVTVTDAETDGTRARTIGAFANNGDVSVTSTGLIVAAGDNSMGIQAVAGGRTDVTVQDLTAIGPNTIGIYAGGADTHVTVNGIVSSTGASDYNSATVTARGTTGYYSGIGGTVTVTNNGSILSSGDNMNALEARGDTDVTINGGGSFATYGDNAKALSLRAGGLLSVDVADVTTQGIGSTGIDATGVTGVTVSAGSVTTSGYGAVGINAVTVAPTPPPYYGGAGRVAAVSIEAVPDVTINAGTVTTKGDYANGIYAFAFGDATVTADTVSTAGNGSSGIKAVALGDATITAGDIATLGSNLYGAGAHSVTGNATVTTTGTVSTVGDHARGVGAQADYGAAAVTVNNVSTQGDLSTAVGAIGYAAIVTVNGTVSTAGNGALGVYARGGFVAGAFNYGAIKTTGSYSAGLVAVAGGDVGVTNTGAIATSGDHSNAISTLSYNGDVGVGSSGTVTAHGAYSAGVVAIARYGKASVANTGSVTTTGDYSGGVIVKGYTGAQAGNTGAISTSGANSDGINATAYGTVTVANLGTIAVSGESSRGIFAKGYYDVNVVGNGSVTTTGNYSAAIAAHGGDGYVTVQAGKVSTSGQVSAGISAYAQVGATIFAGSVSTKGDNAPGIIVGSYGDVYVAADNVTTSGKASDGIRAASFGQDSSIDVEAGNVTTSGAGSHAIWANAFAGDAYVYSSGTVRTTGAGADAITVTGGGSYAGATVNNVIASGAGSSALVLKSTGYAYAYTNGTVSGALDSVSLTTAEGATLVNNGTITTGAGYAVNATGGAVDIYNYGTISGRVKLTGNDDTFHNAGQFIASGTSDFGAGNDTFDNAGTLLVRANGTAPQTVTLSHLETFNNSGTIRLANGVAGDILTMPGAAFTGSGASTLTLDAAYGATLTADELRIGSAAGSTKIALSFLGQNATFSSGTTLVKVGTASSPTAFTLAGGPIDNGFVRYSLVYRPTTLTYQLVGTPSAAAYRTAGFAEGAQQLWYKSADAVSAHLTGIRDAGWGAGADTAKGGALWLQMSGASNSRDQTASFSAAGATLAGVNLDYSQDAFGGQIGYDFASIGETGGVVLGITGGYQNSTLRYTASGDRISFDTLNGGVYGSLKAGALFVTGLAKYDRYWGKARSNAIGYSAKLDGDSYGAQIEAGVRFGSDTFFAEPVASIAYLKTSMDDFTRFGTTVDFDSFTGLRGKAGLRIGGTSTMKSGGKLTFYAAGEAVHEFQGQPIVTLSNAGGAFRFKGDAIGTYGKGTLGVNITGPDTRVSGFIEGFGNVGDSYKGGGGRAGLRIRF